jgi:hypothetical protein
VTRKPFLFFCNADYTNNYYHFQTLLALTTVFLILQCVHFWGTSTAQSGVNFPGHLQFSQAEEFQIIKKQGNFNNIRICNGKHADVLANVDGVLAVQCARNNGGNVKPPAAGFTYNVSVAIPKETSGGDSTDQNGGIKTLVEIEPVHGPGRDPNFTITTEGTNTLVGISNVDTNTELNIFT